MPAVNKKHTQLTILLAEDNPSDAKILCKIVESLDHRIIVAETGLQALECYFTEEIDLAILDIGLPDISGFEVAENFQTGSRVTPIIFTTASINDEKLTECYQRGAGDLLLKPYVPGVVSIKLRAYHNIIRLNSILETQRNLIAKSNRNLLNEQQSAKRIFDKLSYGDQTDYKNVRYNLNALSVFNGDLVLSTKGPGGKLYVFLGDFTGHGLVASLSSVPLIQTFYRMVEKGFSMVDVIQEVNKRLNLLLPRDMFCCGIMVVLDPREGTIQVWNGGLPDCYLFSNEAQTYETISSKHLPLGVLKEQDFRCNIETFKMTASDKFLMCSDGILEAKNINGEMFGSERITEVLENLQIDEDLFEQVQEAAEKFTNGGMREDDVSLVEVTMPKVKSLKKVQVLKTKDYQLETSQVSGNVNYLVDVNMILAGNPVTTLMQLLLDIPGLYSIKSELFTVVTELYANALDHGLLDLDSDLKNSAEGFGEFYKQKKARLEKLDTGSVRFVFDYACNQAHGEIKISVTDSGRGFNVNQWEANRAQKNVFSGRGLSLIEKLSTSMEVKEPGNQINVLLNW